MRLAQTANFSLNRALKSVSENIADFCKKSFSNFMKNLFKKDFNSIEEYFIRFLISTSLIDKFCQNVYSNEKIRNVLSFGSMGGKKFIDNPKYLYLYCSKNLKNYTSYWFTKSIDLYNRLSKMNVNVVYAYSFKSLKILMSSKAVFNSWSLGYDIYP